MISDLNARLRIIAMYILALAIPAAIIGAHYAGRHPVDCDIGDVGHHVGVAYRSLVYEDNIAESCREAAAATLVTLRELEQRPEVGLALAARDAASTLLCGGDPAAIVRAIEERDVAATSREVRALHERWSQVEKPQHP